MRTVLAAASLLVQGEKLFSTTGTVGSPSAFVYAPAIAPESAPLAPYAQQFAQMQYVNPVPYAQPVAYAEQEGFLSGSRSIYAAAGALLVGAVVGYRSATLAVSGRSLSTQSKRTAAPMMFFSGNPDDYDPRVNFSGRPTQTAFKTGKAPTKVKSRKAFSTSRTGSSSIDVTGKAYQDVSTFAPKFDEVGVLPPLGRWDPLQIREQGPERYRRFVEMEIKHGRLAMAGFLGVTTTYSGIRFPGYLSTSENLKFEDIPGGAISSWAALPTAAWFQIVLFISFYVSIFNIKRRRPFLILVLFSFLSFIIIFVFRKSGPFCIMFNSMLSSNRFFFFMQPCDGFVFILHAWHALPHYIFLLY